MKRRLVLITGCILFLHLFSLPVAAQTEIHSIVVEGNEYVSQDKILRVVRLKPGDPYDDKGFADAAKRLFATKEFADVKIFKEQYGSQITVTIVVKEYPRIDGVRFEGNKKIKDDDLSEATQVKEGAFIRPALLRSDHEIISEKYREKGYYRIKVKDELKVERDKKTKKTRTILVYEISEGEKVEIKHIDFFGNRVVDSDDIRKVMESREDRWLRGAEFKPKVLNDDLALIATLYREHGFLDVEVVDKELIFSEDGKGVDVFITLKEGKQYKVGDVTWTGNTVFDDVQIGSKVTFRKYDVFNDTEFTLIQQGINELYWDRGYIYNSVSPEKKVSRKNVIDVNFDIVEGKPAHINEINISGNTKTAERVIRRELVINPGDVFLRPRLLRSLREVFSLGFFEGPPEPIVKPANEEGDIDIDLKVKEKQTGQFRLGAGFSSLNSISGFIGIAETNFLGRGQQIGIDWEFSRYRQNVDLRFTEPWLFGTPTELSINLFNRIQNQVRQQFFNDRRQGISIRVGRPFPWFDYTSAFVRYRYELVELTNFSAGYLGPLLTIDWPQRTSSMAFTVLRNSTDSPFRPTKGTRSTFTVEFNGGILGGDVRFHRYEAGFSWYESLFWKFVLQLKYSAAILDGYSSPKDVPDYELFRLGGNRRYGVRGYDFYEIVPRGNPPYLGGRFMHIMGYELSFAVGPTVTLLGFFDMGNTWNSFEGADVADLRKGIGVGIRIELPMLGTVGFDYGYGYDRIGGPAWEPHLTFGAGF
ncbi:MAG: outer membrane protein assembly factor BamA [Candidatus Latescibacterota bacterium]|nr:MAG: outer membrane protein assembly factor BamA [Candidatus Latescibacterota bacterium]